MVVLRGMSRYDACVHGELLRLFNGAYQLVQGHPSPFRASARPSPVTMPMGYPPRLCFDGAIYHVTNRGNNRASLFLDEADYAHYLLLLQRYKQRFRFTLHAYALMPNHVHLLLEPAAQTTVSRILQCLTIAYTKWFNRRHSHVGHVVQGRFHSRLIEKDSYLLVASRYIHLNPVKAKLVRHPHTYAWSSYHAYRDPSRDRLQLVDTMTVLGLMDTDPRCRQDAYRAFVESHWRGQPVPSDAWLSQRVVGSPRFVRAVQARCVRRQV